MPARKARTEVTPCKSCPYRKDAPLALWHASEFAKVREAERAEMGGLFACHGEVKKKAKDRGFCIGWLLDQKARGIPSIKLRLVLLMQPEAKATFQACHSGGAEMYASAIEMCEANDRMQP